MVNSASPRSKSSKQATDESASAVKSADRVLLVLEHLAEAKLPRAPGDIADALGIPRSSLHGLLRTMHNRGWVELDEGAHGVRYRIGARALSVGVSFLHGDDIVARSASMLDALSRELGETLHLGVLEHDDVVYLAKREAKHNLRLVSAVGVRLPAYATALGKVLLADLDDEALLARLDREHPALTPHTLVTGAALRADLEETRLRGYAIDDQESTEGVRCFAVPLGKPGTRRYAISCSVPVARLDSRLERRIVDLLLRAAETFEEPAELSLLSH